MSAIVSLRNVSKEFPGQGTKGAPVHAVDDVSFDVEQGSVVGIVGYSGAGKSTLVRLINGLERQSAGRILIKGQDISDLPERELRPVRAGIGMIFQQFNLLKSRTVYGKHRLSAQSGRLAEGQNQAQGRGTARFRRHLGQGRQVPAPALRRTAAACRHCPSPGQRARPPPGR